MLTQEQIDCIRELPSHVGNEESAIIDLFTKVSRNPKILATESCSLELNCMHCPFSHFYNSEDRMCGYGSHEDYVEIAKAGLNELCWDYYDKCEAEEDSESEVTSIAHVGDCITYGELQNFGEIIEVHSTIEATDSNELGSIKYLVKTLPKKSKYIDEYVRVSESSILEIYRKVKGN